MIRAFGRPLTRLLSRTRWMPLFGAALLPAAAAWSQPASVEWKISSSVGYEDMGTLYTRLEKPLAWEVEGGTPGATVRIYADATLLVEKRLGNGKGVLKAKNLFDLIGEGTFTIRATEVIEDVEGGSADFLTLVVDRTPPAIASAPDLDPTSDTGVADDDNITAADDLHLTGTGEPGAWVFVAIDGKAKNTKKLNKALGVIAGDGLISVVFDDAKNGEQQLSFCLVDGAGNTTVSTNTLMVDVSVKTPAPPKKLDLSEDDKFSERPVLVTGDRTPNLVGEGIPGFVINLYHRGDDEVLGTGVVDVDGSWEVGVDMDLEFGFQELVATHVDFAGAESKDSARLQFFVFDETNGGRPFDNFNDNLIDDELWIEFETDSDAIRVTEASERLEFPMFGGFTNDVEVAGLLSNEWALSMDEDWRIEVDFRLDAPPLGAGDVGLLIAFLGDATLTGATVETIDGVEFLIGRDDDGEYVGITAVFDGDVEFENFINRGGDTGTIFLWFDESDDAIYFSPTGFNTGALLAVANVRENFGYDRMSLFMGGFADRTFPILEGQKAYYDDFSVKAGMIVETDLGSPTPLAAGYIPSTLARFAPSARFDDDDLDELLHRKDDEDTTGWFISINLGGAGPCDVNHDGSIDHRDATLVISFMGSHRFGWKHCDVDRNGVIDDRDLRVVLTVIAR